MLTFKDIKFQGYLTVLLYADYRRCQNCVLSFILILHCLNRGGGAEIGKVDKYWKFLPPIKIIHQFCRQRHGVVRIVCSMCINEANFYFMLWEDGYIWFQFDKLILISLEYLRNNLFEKISPKELFKYHQHLSWSKCAIGKFGDV